MRAVAEQLRACLILARLLHTVVTPFAEESTANAEAEAELDADREMVHIDMAYDNWLAPTMDGLGGDSARGLDTIVQSCHSALGCRVS